MTAVRKKLLFIALPAAILARRRDGGWRSKSGCAGSGTTARGTPGFFVSHPTRGQRLGINYDGWFAGVPVQINALGFRDRRATTAIEKRQARFGSCVLGDSVTFGHGAVRDDYPSLLEQQLKQWRPTVELAGLEPRRPRLQHQPGTALPPGGRSRVQAGPGHRRLLHQRLHRQRRLRRADVRPRACRAACCGCCSSTCIRTSSTSACC